MGIIKLEGVQTVKIFARLEQKVLLGDKLDWCESYWTIEGVREIAYNYCELTIRKDRTIGEQRLIRQKIERGLYAYSLGIKSLLADCLNSCDINDEICQEISSLEQTLLSLGAKILQ